MTENTKRPLVPQDLFSFKFVGRPVFSPDAKKAVYTLAKPDKESNGYHVNVWLYDAESGETTQFTHSKAQDTAPAWSPCGKHIAFVSDRSGDKQIWVMPSTGGEAKQLTQVKGGLTEFAWSPDAKRIAFISKWDGSTEEECEDKKKYKSDVKVYTRIKHKFDGGGFWDNKWRQLWVIDVETGKVNQLTSGEHDVDGIAWSPDCCRIAFVSARRTDPDLTNIRDLWTVGVDDKQLSLLFESKGPVSSPAWHPSGNLIGFVGHENQHTNTTNDALWIVPQEGGTAKNLTASYDLSVGGGVTGDMRYQVAQVSWTWSQDGAKAYFLANVRGSRHLFSVDLDGSVSTVLDKDGDILGFDVSDTGEILFTHTDHYNPGDLFRARPGQEPIRLTQVNDLLLSAVRLAEVEELDVKGADGWPIQAWLMKPKDFDATKKHPLVLEIHGGPHAMYGNTFFFEFQLLAAKGFLVLFVNPRGSDGYGEAFRTACKGDWGGKDYEDLMLALDQVIARGFVDEANMGVTGGSYGGFMTNWVVGHTDRFKAACTQRCVSNLFSFYGTSDIGPLFGEHEFPGNPWDNLDVLLERSPFSYVKNIDTPLLIIHSEQDHRCPIEQAEQMFTALRRMGKETEFVRFPDESHDLSRSGKPHHRVERLERIVGWFEKRIL